MLDSDIQTCIPYKVNGNAYVQPMRMHDINGLFQLDCCFRSHV